MGLAGYLSRSREGLNSVAKDFGNRLYDGLGDKLSGDVDVRGLARVGVVSAVIGVGGLVGGCGNGNAQYTNSGIPRVPSKVASRPLGKNFSKEYNAGSLATDLIKGCVSFGLMNLEQGPSYKYSLRSGSNLIVYADKNENGSIENGLETFYPDEQIDISEFDFMISTHGKWGKKYNNIIINPNNEKIFEKEITPMNTHFRVGDKHKVNIYPGFNYIYSTNLFRVDGYKENIRDVSWIANEVIKNPGNYTFIAERGGSAPQKNTLNLFCSDPTKMSGRTGVGQVESIGSNSD